MKAPQTYEASDIVVSGLGVASALGEAVTAAAASRAGLSRPSELDFVVRHSDTMEDVSIVGHEVAAVAGFRGMARLVALCGGAIADLLSRAAPLDRSDGLGFYLCLTDQSARRGTSGALGDVGELRERQRQDDRERGAIVNRIIIQTGLPVSVAHRRVYVDGAAGLARAVADAHAALRAGELVACIVGGVDSLVGRSTLDAMQESRRLKGPDQAEGMIPGEAASFLLLERNDRASALGHRTLGGITASVANTGADPRTIDHPLRGVTLTELYEQLSAAAGPLEAGTFWLITDQNGELFRVHEWTDFLLRAGLRYPALKSAPLWYPAISFGDTGAASSSLAVILALRAFARGYAPADTAVIVSTTIEGARGALRVRRPRGTDDQLGSRGR